MPYIVSVLRTLPNRTEATIHEPGFPAVGRTFFFKSQREAELFLSCSNFAFIQGFWAGDQVGYRQRPRTRTVREGIMLFRHSDAFLHGENVGVDRRSSRCPDQMEQKRLAEMAYSFWEHRGRPMGSADEDWFRAEQELCSLAEKSWEIIPGVSSNA